MITGLDGQGGRGQAISYMVSIEVQSSMHLMHPNSKINDIVQYNYYIYMHMHIQVCFYF